MPCYRPLAAFQCSDGSVVFNEGRSDVVRSLNLPCGQCVGCRLERSRQWAVRCMHEASLYENNCFITLTYRDADLPEDKSLRYEDFQLFMKRLRKRFKGIEPVTFVPEKKIRNRFGTVLEVKKLPPVTHYPIRFYMAGEYGEQFRRPHFHACIFNFDFPDKKYHKKTPGGSRIFTSAALSELWPFGYSSVGSVTFESAAYVARYIMKKVNVSSATPHHLRNHYEEIDEDGVINELVPEFNKMSLKPGIGQGWYDKFKDEVYPDDFVVVNGRKCKPPRFYDRKFADEFPLEFEQIQFDRYVDAQDRIEDNTPERLAVRERVTQAKVERLVRNL
jgi:hypothetical protein